MSLYFIEMGQGIISTDPIRVKTSALYTCTFVAGFNSQSAMGGAYHYPANGFKSSDIKKNLLDWMENLKPTKIVLVYAPIDDNRQGGVSSDDKEYLMKFSKKYCSSISTVEAVAAGMKLVNKVFAVGSLGNTSGLYGDSGFHGTVVNVKDKKAGRYQSTHSGSGIYTLIGKNHSPN